MNGPSLRAKIFLSLLKKAHYGTVEVALPDGHRETFGDGAPFVKVKINSYEAFDRMFSRGDLGLAEAIIEGEMEVNDPAALVEWACRNDQALGETIYGRWYGTILAKLRFLLAENSRKGAKKNIVAHYDLGNEFYGLWLDKSMTYSSAIYSEAATESLEQAQMAKYDRIIDQLDIKAGQHVLEIGCGWGGFFSRAVERKGCRVTAVMNSPSQAKHNRERIQAQGMGANVNLLEQDYRDIQGKFDRVVSIEMVEAVGEKYWGDFFGKVSSALAPKGSALIQGITIREDLFSSYRKNTDFIQQYVFPGGMLLTNDVFVSQGKKSGMQLTDTFEFALSYARTLRIWRENFERSQAEVRRMGFDDKFMRMWSLYLAYCEGAFRAGRISVGQFQLAGAC